MKPRQHRQTMSELDKISSFLKIRRHSINRLHWSIKSVKLPESELPLQMFCGPLAFFSFFSILRVYKRPHLPGSQFTAWGGRLPNMQLNTQNTNVLPQILALWRAQIEFGLTLAEISRHTFVLDRDGIYGTIHGAERSCITYKVFLCRTECNIHDYMQRPHSTVTLLTDKLLCCFGHHCF